jgi:hypothetical protein
MSRPTRNPEPIHELIRSAYAFLERAAGEIANEPKYSIINFATGIELMLKARLVKEHWALVVERTSDANKADFMEGRLRTVTPKDAVERLRKICGEAISKDADKAFQSIADHRNKVIHFFHEATSEGADPALREAVTKEQCPGWYHLEQLIEKWDKPFTTYSKEIRTINALMRKNRAYLQTLYDRLLPGITKDEANGRMYADCGGCGFRSARVDIVSTKIKEQRCEVCKLWEQYTEVPCPEQCGSTIRIAGESKDRVCPKCNHHLTRDELYEALDVEMIDREAPPPNRNCPYCMEMGTVVKHENDVYVCAECLSISVSLAYCEWCGEGQLGATKEDMAMSSFSGCEFCDGRGE